MLPVLSPASRYDSKGKVEEKRVQAIQLRVCVVLKYWIENQCADFDDTLIKVIEITCSYYVC